MLSREFRPAFGAISRLFVAFPVSTEDDSGYSAVAIIFQGLLWFLFLAFIVAPVAVRAGAASERRPATAGSQSYGAPTNDTHVASNRTAQGIHVDVDLALVSVNVTDPYDRPVTGLDSSNFRVFENNVEQEVLTFSMEDTPISVGIIFDNSGSMANKIGRARQAVIEFLKTSNPED